MYLKKKTKDNFGKYKFNHKEKNNKKNQNIIRKEINCLWFGKKKQLATSFINIIMSNLS